MTKEAISQTEGLCKEVANCIRNAYDRGYKQGYKDGQAHQLASDDMFRKSCEKSAYEKGLNDAWECLKKIVFEKDDGGFTFTEIAEIFDGKCLSTEILESYSPSEAITRIKKYEEKQKRADDEIKVGDEILIHNIQDAETYKAVVMDIDMDKGLWIFDENACNTVIEPKRYIGEEADLEVRKTGRHFDQIAEILEQLKEGQDETK